jgi:hypothetical protein
MECRAEIRTRACTDREERVREFKFAVLIHEEFGIVWGVYKTVLKHECTCVCTTVKNGKICSLSNCFGWSSVCFGSIETSKLSVSV